MRTMRCSECGNLYTDNISEKAPAIICAYCSMSSPRQKRESDEALSQTAKEFAEEIGAELAIGEEPKEKEVKIKWKKKVSN